MNSAPPASTDLRPGLVAGVPALGALIAISAALFAAVIGLAVWLWGFRTPPVQERIVPAQAAQLAPELKAKADALVEEAAKLEAQLQTPGVPVACPPGKILKTEADSVQPPTMPPATMGRTSTQPDQKSAAPSPAVPPVAGGGTAAKLTLPDLTARVERAVALVVTKDSVATGFFISDNLLLTNRHAVESATDKRVEIVSRSLGGVRPGEVLSMSRPGRPGSEDFALVRLRQGSAPGVLPFSDQAPKLSSIVAAGYPGLTLRSDDGFRRLVAGDVSAAPDLNFTQGVVQSLQTTPQGAAVILHTASVLQGNSGGPLIDLCGRAIGVNTFIAVDAESAGRTSYAQTTAGVARFLSGLGVTLAIDSHPCSGP